MKSSEPKYNTLLLFLNLAVGERYVTPPRNLLNSSLLVGAGMDTIQSCFLGSGIYPLSVRPHPYACRTVQSSSVETSPD